MKIEIKSRWDSRVLFTAEAASLLLALEAAVKAGANLEDADLRGADLEDAYLRVANLEDADLRGADLEDANLRGADLRGANLGGADLEDANLRGAYLGGANLEDADLRGANLRGAYLGGANLGGANLEDANLRGANLRGAKNAELSWAQTKITPEGNLVGWKKCKDNVIVKLLIPQNAKRSNATGRKCRAEYAKVLRIFNGSKGISQWDSKTIYRKGETVRCSEWSADRWVECGGGIHFYLTREEAEANYD